MTLAAPAVEAQPLIMTDAAITLNGMDLKCLANHVEVSPDVSVIEAVTMCGTREYPGATKWYLRLTLYQSFDEGGTDEILAACLAATGPVPFAVRPYGARPISKTNPSFEGTVIPKVYPLLAGDAGDLSTVEIEWTLTGPPERVTTPDGGEQRTVTATATPSGVAPAGTTTSTTPTPTSTTPTATPGSTTSTTGGTP